MTDLTRREKISLGTKEIAKRIRGQLKTEFPGCKFSVRMQSYSGGSSITVSMMKADRKMKLDFDHIDKGKIARALDSRYTMEELRKLQEKDDHQLNHYTLSGEFDSRHWCNGVFLTLQGHNLLRRVVQIQNEYNYDNSDSMTDYYSVNFSFSIELGKWDKPFDDGTGYVNDPALDTRINTRIKEIEVNTAKAKIEKEAKDKLDRLERDSHVEKSRRTVAEIKSIMRATAIIGANGFEVMTQEAKAKKILELDEVKQALKTRSGIDWVKEIFEI